MPIVRIRDDGKIKKNGKLIVYLGLITIVAGTILFTTHSESLGIFMCTFAAAVSSTFSVFDNS